MASDPARASAVLAAQRLEKSYGSGRTKVPVLRGVDVTVRAGEFVAVMGPSGCGKTTLLNCLSGLDTVDSGSVLLEGQDLGRLSDRKRTRQRGERVGFVFQSFNLVPVLTALQNVQLPLELRGVARSSARKRSEEALAAVGVADQAAKLPLEMSGGQQQRVAIARALANEPAVVFADEPTGNLDTKTGEEVLNVFQRLNRERGVTFIVVTHDTRVASRATRVIHMDSGRIASDSGTRLAPPATRATSKPAPPAAPATSGSTPLAAATSAPATSTSKAPPASRAPRHAAAKAPASPAPSARSRAGAKPDAARPGRQGKA